MHDGDGPRRLLHGVTRVLRRLVTRGPSEREMVEAAASLDSGSRATLEKCLEAVRSAAVDARVALTPYQLLEVAAGRRASPHATPPTLLSSNVRDLVHERWRVDSANEDDS